MNRFALAAVLGLALAPLGCGSGSEARSCLTEGAGEVCASLEGGVRVAAEGLEPGSALTVSVVDGPSQTVEVGGDGGIGTIGFLSAVAPEEATIDLRATAADGAPIAGRLHLTR